MSAILVLDVSATLPWCFEDEVNAASIALLERIGGAAVVVPSLWYAELGNALLQAERRERIAAGDIEAFLGLLGELVIETDHDLDCRALGSLLALARHHQLTGYDATYLDLALRRDLPIATRDGALRRAAHASGVALIEA